MIVIGAGNPGWTFTLERMNQIKILFDFIKTKDKQERYNYKDMQKEASEFNEILNPSKIRMFIPWFERFGICKYNKNVNLYGDLLTKLGNDFVEFCSIYVSIMNDQNNYSQEQINAVCDMYRAFIYKFYENVMKSDRASLYKQIIISLDKYGYLTREEFFILTTKIETGKSEEWLDASIYSFRRGEITIDPKKIKNQNAYGYIIPFCCEAGITIVDKEKRILPARKINFEGALENVR